MQAHYARGVVDAQGNLKIDALPLLAGETVEVFILPTAANANGATVSEPSNGADPLAGIRVATGIPDLAERFDDYRLGKLPS